MDFWKSALAKAESVAKRGMVRWREQGAGPGGVEGREQGGASWCSQGLIRASHPWLRAGNEAASVAHALVDTALVAGAAAALQELAESTAEEAGRKLKDLGLADKLQERVGTSGPAQPVSLETGMCAARIRCAPCAGCPTALPRTARAQA